MQDVNDRRHESVTTESIPDRPTVGINEPMNIKMTLPEALKTALKYQQSGNLREAEQIYRQILKIKPDQPDAWHLLGMLGHECGLHDKAIEYIKRAIEYQPNNASFHRNLSLVYMKSDRPDLAETACRRAVELTPNSAEAFNSLGNALQTQCKMSEAMNAYAKAIELKPDFAMAHNNLANTYFGLGRPCDAIAEYDRALALKPDYVCARVHRGISRLLDGQFEAGWTDYENRWQCEHWQALLPNPRFPQPLTQPRWNGTPLGDRTLFVYTEQGLGDTLQFIRYLNHIPKDDGRIVFESHHAPLERIVGRMTCIDEVVAQGTVPSCDVHIPLLSLPGLLGTRVDSIPADGAYVDTDETLDRQVRDVIGEVDDLKVGINWQGNPGFPRDRLRSVPLEQFIPLADIPGIRWFSLQHGHGLDQLPKVSDHFPIIDLGSRLDQLAEDACQESGPYRLDLAASAVSQMDLVITTDTMMAHLAGALNQRTWCLLPVAPDWRWLMNRNDCPWYPAMRLFRQQEVGDWASVIQRIRTALPDIHETR